MESLATQLKEEVDRKVTEMEKEKTAVRAEREALEEEKAKCRS